jgi:hypothetical protein
MFISGYCVGQGNFIFAEAESFQHKGGWVVDPQFVEQMGSPYLLAHGMGKPVEDASTTVKIQTAGLYHVWVRTKNWAPGNWDAPGRFNVLIDGKKLKYQLGLKAGWNWEYAGEIHGKKLKYQLGLKAGWNWEYAGEIQLAQGNLTLQLHDLTGFEGRCDAVYMTLSGKENLPNDLAELKKWRAGKSGEDIVPKKVEQYDLVVVGGGIAGCAAALAAAEQGINVALVHDRPVLGGNASGEIRVHTLGIYGKFERILKMIDTEHYPNGSAEALKEDQKRMENIRKYKNIHLFLNYRAYAATSQHSAITSVDARNTISGEQVRIEAPLFVDSTGDGWIGYWAGAETMYGREASSQYGEAWDAKGQLWSPDKPDNSVMGSSLLWNSENAGKKVDFPKVPWAMEVAKNYAEKNGEWQWEYTRNDLNQVDDAETIRDHMFRAIYGSFYNYKHPVAQHKKDDKAEIGNMDLREQQARADSLQLKWVSYLLGKRESRRLVGDYIYTFNDERDSKQFEDAVVYEKREVDVHYQVNLLDTAKPDFISEAMFYKTKPYQLPYRSLYSKNIDNLFMAGRNFSCSHAGLGGPRVMRTTGQMGAAVGIAASLCKKYNCSPRDIYRSHLEEYLGLIDSQQ